MAYRVSARISKTLVGIALMWAVVAAGSWSPVRAATTEVGTTTVSFTIAEVFEVLAWPSSTYSLGEAGTPGVTVVSEELTFTVRSNASWGVEIRSDTGTGELREFDIAIGAYVDGGRSVGPVEWATSVSGPWHPLSSTPAVMYSMQPPTGAAGRTVGFVLRVTPTFDDEPLPEGREYRMVLTYTAGVGF